MAKNWWEDSPIVKSDGNEWWKSSPIVTAEPKERTWGEAATDLGASLGVGAGNLVQLPGQLYGLATGDFEDSGILGLGKSLVKSSEAMKSEGLKQREALRAQKIAEADKKGMWEGFKTAFGSTVTDIPLLVSFLAEQAPQLLVPLGAGKAGSAISMGNEIAAGVVRKEAAAEAGQAGVKAAIGAGGVQQGADVGAQSYEDIYKYLVTQGTPPEDAKQQALDLARATGAAGTVISLLAQRLPGAKSLEEALVGVPMVKKTVAGIPLTGAAGRAANIGKAALGETGSEMVEEGGGKFTQNLAMRDVNPNQSLTEGVGSTAGLAAVGGVGMGGFSGALQKVAPSTTAPESFTPTHQNSSGVPFMHVEGNKYVDEYGNEVERPTSAMKPIEMETFKEPVVPVSDDETQKLVDEFSKTEEERAAKPVAEVFTVEDPVTKSGINKDFATAEEAQAHVDTLTSNRNALVDEHQAVIDNTTANIDTLKQGLDTEVAKGNSGTAEFLAHENNINAEVSKLSNTLVQEQAEIARLEQPIQVVSTNTPTVEVTPAPAPLEGVTEPVYTPALAAKIKQLRQSLLPTLERFGLKDVGLNIVASIQNGTANAHYVEQVMQIAYNARDPMGSLRHESIHALKELGAFTENEWRVLSQRAKDTWINQFISEKNQTKYKAIYQKKNKTMDGFDAYLQEEAIAEAFRHFAKTKPPAGLVGQLYSRLNSMFQSLGNSFKQLGYTNAEAIFQKIERGEAKPKKVEKVAEKVAEKAAEKPVKVKKAPEVKEQAQVTVNLSNVTKSIPGLQELYARAMAGDKAAYTTLQRTADSHLRHLLSAINVNVDIQHVMGAYSSEREPALNVVLTVAETDKAKVMASLARFAHNFNQEQIHVRQLTTEKIGHDFGDGSYATPVYTIDAKNTLTNDDIANIIEKTGIPALTVIDNKIITYWVEPNEKSESGFKEYIAQVKALTKLVGASGKRVIVGVERLYVYGTGYGARLEFDSIEGDVRSKEKADTTTAGLIGGYFKGEPLTTFKQTDLTKTEVADQEHLAKIFEELPVNGLKLPIVRRAYNALITELVEQFKVLPIKVEVVTDVIIDGKSYSYFGKDASALKKALGMGMVEADVNKAIKYLQDNYGEPNPAWKTGLLSRIVADNKDIYGSSEDVMRDVGEHNTLKLYKTSPETFGVSAAEFKSHPLLKPSGLKDSKGYPMLYNDLFRAVHDYYAHNISETQFGPKGEFAAAKNHLSLTKDPMAKWALVAETRMQNAWQNFRSGVEKTPLKDRSFSEQKVALPPLKYVLTGDNAIDASVYKLASELTAQQRLGSLSPDSKLAEGMDKPFAKETKPVKKSALEAIWNEYRHTALPFSSLSKEDIQVLARVKDKDGEAIDRAVQKIYKAIEQAPTEAEVEAVAAQEIDTKEVVQEEVQQEEEEEEPQAPKTDKAAIKAQKALDKAAAKAQKVLDKAEAKIEAKALKLRVKEAVKQAKKDINNSEVGQALQRVKDENFDMDDKKDIRSFYKKLVKHDILEEGGDTQEYLSDRESEVSDVLYAIENELQDAYDNALQERIDEVTEEAEYQPDETPVANQSNPQSVVESLITKEDTALLEKINVTPEEIADKAIEILGQAKNVHNVRANAWSKQFGELAAQVQALLRRIMNGMMSVVVGINLSVAPPAIQPHTSIYTYNTPIHVANFKGAEHTEGVQRLANAILDSKKNDGMAFVIADKASATMYVFDENGNLRGSSPVLLGAAKGDKNFKMSMSAVESNPVFKTTPSGIFTTTTYKHEQNKSAYGYEWSVQLNETLAKDNSAVAIHAVYLHTPSENRQARLDTKSIEDNRVSWGCLNAPLKFMQDVVKPTFEKENGKVFITPEEMGNDAMLGLPAAKTKTVKKLTQSLETESGHLQTSKQEDMLATESPMGRFQLKEDEEYIPQTLTEKFKRFFGNSEIVNRDGTPKVMYHATARDITIFKPKQADAIFLTDSPDFAQTFAETSEDYMIAEAKANMSETELDSLRKQAEKISKKEGTSYADVLYELIRDSLPSNQNIMPVYVSAKNVFDFENPAHLYMFEEAGISAHDIERIKIGSWHTIEQKYVQDVIKKAGFDGFYVLEGGKKNLGVYTSNQIKSAIGNNGEFDINNPDIRYQFTEDEEFVEPSGKLDNVTYLLQDKFIDLKRVIQSLNKRGKVIADKWNTYLQEELYHGRVSTRIDFFMKRQLNPVLKQMDAAGITVVDMDNYLLARHAEEANAHIANVNADPSANAGMTNDEATEYMDAIPANKRQVYERIAQQIDTMTKETRDMMVSYGLEKKGVIDSWEHAYKHYVPLMREQDESDTGSLSFGTGKGYSVKGKTIKARIGSAKSVVDVLANIALQRERIIARGEKNRVGQSLLGLVLTNPNSDFWVAVNPHIGNKNLTKELIELGLDPSVSQNLGEAPIERVPNAKTGEAQTQINPLWRKQPNVFVTRVNGEDRVVIFNMKDARAKRMAVSFSNLTTQNKAEVIKMEGEAGAYWDSLTKNVGKGTRWFASINTQYNPAFGLYNLLRDIGGATLNLQSTALKGKEFTVITNAFVALRAVYKDLRLQREGKPADSAWAKKFEEFELAGGKTGFSDLFNNSEEKAHKLQEEINSFGKKGVKQTRDAVFGWLSDFNSAIENCIRVSAYDEGIKSGLSQDQSASIAKNLTVNFNRTGARTKLFTPLYAFFNASVQGTARIAETMYKDGKLTPAGKKIIAGSVILGVVQAVAIAAAGFDENDPPEWVKDKNIIIPYGNKKYIAIPMPLGFNIFPSFARRVTEFAMSDEKNIGKAATSTFAMIIDGFNPLGSGTVMQTALPTLLDPIAAIAENKDFSGRPIARDDMNSLEPTPGYSRAKENASSISVGIAYAINILTGGTEFQKGFISPVPDTLDYLFGQVTGGVGREAMKIGKAGSALISGEELSTNNVPVVGRMIGNANQRSAETARFYENIKRLNEHKAEIEGRAKSDQEIDAYMEKHPESALYEEAGKFYKQISDLHKAKKELKLMGADKEDIKALDDAALEYMVVVNEIVRDFKHNN